MNLTLKQWQDKSTIYSNTLEEMVEEYLEKNIEQYIKPGSWKTKEEWSRLYYTTLDKLMYQASQWELQQ